MILVTNPDEGLRTMGQWAPGGDWNLPDEFEFPGKFMLTSDKAQFILEQGAYAGYGQAPMVAPFFPPGGSPQRHRAVGHRTPQRGGTKARHTATGGRAPQELRGYGKIIHTGLPPVLQGYSQVDPLGWYKYRLMQGRSLKAGGYRGYGTTWDQFANRLTVPG